MSKSVNWYVNVNGELNGPYSEAQIRSGIKTGKITSKMRIKLEDGPWRAIEDVLSTFEFDDACRARPPKPKQPAFVEINQTAKPIPQPTYQVAQPFVPPQRPHQSPAPIRTPRSKSAASENVLLRTSIDLGRFWVSTGIFLWLLVIALGFVALMVGLIGYINDSSGMDGVNGTFIMLLGAGAMLTGSLFMILTSSVACLFSIEKNMRTVASQV